MTDRLTPMDAAPALRLDSDRRWFEPARRRPSPNQDARPARCAIDLVVIHNISLPPGCFGGPDVERLFLNQLDPTAHPFFREIHTLRVSAHLFVDRRGGLTQFVPLHRRAWHAGLSSHEGREACNDFSIGIELEGTDHTPFEAVQYQQLVRILGVLFGAFPTLTPQRLVGHSDIAPGRKTDPGPAFDWARLEHDLIVAGHGKNSRIT